MLDIIYLQLAAPFSSLIAEWASLNNIEVVDYDIKTEEHVADGLLIINENQDIEREVDDLHTLFDAKHIPTQKIDLNGTLQVAVSNFENWIGSNGCKKILILGSDQLIENRNFSRFLSKIEKNKKVNAQSN